MYNTKKEKTMSNYIKPVTRIVAVETQQMIAESLNTMSGEAEEWGAKDNGGMLWDEDDDDDPMGAPSFDIWED